MLLDNKKVCVMVAGSWGTALAKVLADKGYQVWLWSRNQEQVDHINKKHNNIYLPDIELPTNIQATTSVQTAVEDAHAVLLVSPSAAVRELSAKIHPFVKEQTLIIHASKGFEVDSLKRMSEVIAEELPQVPANRLVVLSGPSHAEEVAKHNPTTVVVASACLQEAERAQSLLMNTYFRVYTHTDVIGVETGGALKNIIAIGAGIVDGLGFGDNAKAALMTRGLVEISRLGVAMGAEHTTFSGLAGMGDLIVTCTSKHSRNWRAGYAIGQGQSLDKVLDAMGMVVEGIQTTKSALTLAQKYNVKMPITTELYKVLFQNKSPHQAVLHLMERAKTQEG